MDPQQYFRKKHQQEEWNLFKHFKIHLNRNLKNKSFIFLFINILAHDAIFLVGNRSGSFSIIDGTAGAE